MARARARGALAWGALALGALALGSRAEGTRAEGGFPTPAGYAELPSAEDCRGPGCDSLRMSGKELLERWWTTPEGGKHWFHAVNPLQKQAKDLGENSLRALDLTETVSGLGGFELADAILKHLADLEDKVEAEHERLTGEPAAQASRHEKAARLLVAHREETGTAYEEAVGIILEDEEKEYLTALHVNVYHQMTGYLRWPHYDWRPVPSPPEADVVCDRDMAGIYVISLVKRTDRREALEAAMPAKLSYSYIDAVDGSTLTDSEFDQLIYQGTMDDANPMVMGLVPSTLMLWQDYPNPYFEYYWDTKIKKGEVGLNLSLRRAFESALIDGREAALIMEDDHAVKDLDYCLFLHELQKVDASGFKWDFILLEAYNWFGDDAAAVPEGLSPYFTVLSAAHNTHAVMWSARGMRRVLESDFFEGCQVPLDDLLAYMTNPGRWPRNDFHDCLGPGGGVAPERLVALRWRGARVVADLDTQDVSSIDAEL